MAVEWVIQADDLTGAADTAVGFAAAGLQTLVVPWRAAALAAPPDAAVLAFDTASRDLDAGTAAQRAGTVARWFARHCDDRAWMYKKLDSTLRGNAAAELSAVERELSPSRVVVAPAFPALGRTTVDGRQRWDGEAVDVAALLGPSDGATGRRRRAADGGPRRAGERARGPAGAAAARRLRRSRGSARPATRVVVGLSAAGERTGAGRVGQPDAARRPAGRGAGMATRVALDGDAAGALAAGEDVLLTGPAGPLSRAAARALHAVTPRLVIVVGGDTAHALCTALGVETLRAEREVAPGAPLLRCTLADGRELRLVLKSGSFGDDDVLARIVTGA